MNIPTVPLKRVARLRAGGTPNVDDPAYWDDEGLPWVTIGDMTRQRNVVETGRLVSAAGIADKRLPIGEPGTILFAMYASVGETAVLGTRATWNQAILGITPATGSDGRFLKYWLDGLRPRLAELFRSTTQDNINAEQVGRLPFPRMPPGEQARIADYLDREAARIDHLIAAKRRMKGLLLERLNTSAERQLNALLTSSGQAPLKFLADEITVGIVITPSEWYADNGVPALRGLNVRAGELRLDDLVHLSMEGHQKNLKSQLHSGNLVTVRTGQAGATAIVPQELDGANCIDLLITRPGPRLLPEFLELVFNSDWVVKHIDANSVGAIQSHFNVAALRELPVPSVSLEVQREVAGRLVVERALVWKLMEHLTSQMKLLGERRQALITAAVGGDLAISGVAAA